MPRGDKCFVENQFATRSGTNSISLDLRLWSYNNNINKWFICHIVVERPCSQTFTILQLQYSDVEGQQFNESEGVTWELKHRKWKANECKSRKYLDYQVISLIALLWVLHELYYLLFGSKKEYFFIDWKRSIYLSISYCEVRIAFVLFGNFTVPIWFH